MPNSFLHVFRSHKALLSVDPATQRGPLPPALARGLPDVKQQHIDTYAMLVELRYMDDSVISPPLRITAVSDNYPCLTSALERGQKITIPFEGDFNPAHFSFAVTIVRRRDGKCECKRIFQFPSPSESFCDFGDFTASLVVFDGHQSTSLGDAIKVLMFDCPLPELRSSAGLSGLQVFLGIANCTDAYEAESVEMYSYGDDGELVENGIGETLRRIEYAGMWF